MKTSALLLACAAFALAIPAAASADGVTMRGRPGEAKDILLLENTAMFRMSNKETYTDGTRFVLDWNLGLLHNTGDRAAFGGAMKLTADGDGSRFGFVGRYRRWLSGDASVDISPGLYVTELSDAETYAYPSPTLDVALQYKDKIGLVLGADLMRLAHQDGSEFQVRAGLRFGGWITPVVTAGYIGLAAASMSGYQGL